MKLVGIFALATALAACGAQTPAEKGAEAPVSAQDEITFNDEDVTELTAESEALPESMIVRVPLREDGTEDLASAELRTAPTLATETNVESTYNFGNTQQSPKQGEKFVVVNPPNQQQQKPQPKPPKGGKGKNGSGYYALANVTTTSGAIAIGRRGVVVSGNHTSVGNNGLGYGHGLYGAYGNSYAGGSSYGYGYSSSSSYSSNYYSNYYSNFYRPVYRSRHRFGGYGAYWGYYHRPIRYVRGGHCYYVYPRPRCSGYCYY